MHWRRLDREQTLSVLDSVKSAADPGLFAPTTSEVKTAILPFYKNMTLYQVTNFASLPSFTFQYIGDGEFFSFLDGTKDPIYAANDKGELNLNSRTVIEYLSFYFDSVGMDDGEECHLIQNPNDMPMFDSLDDQTMRAIYNNHLPPEVTEKEDIFTVVAEIYADGQVNRATIEVNGKNGRVVIKDQTMIWNSVSNNGFVAPEPVAEY
jgi:hypothetical protein